MRGRKNVPKNVLENSESKPVEVSGALRNATGKPSTKSERRAGTHHHEIIATDAEWAAWNKLADAEHLTMAGWVRRSLRLTALQKGVTVPLPYLAPDTVEPPPQDVVHTRVPAGRISEADVHKWIATNIRRRRRELSLFQRDLARRVGLARAVMTRIESGNTNRISLVALLRIANALRMTLADLVTEPQDMGPLTKKTRGHRTSGKPQETVTIRQPLETERAILRGMEVELGFKFDPET